MTGKKMKTRQSSSPSALSTVRSPSPNPAGAPSSTSLPGKGKGLRGRRGVVKDQDKTLHPLEIPIKKLKNDGSGYQYSLSFLPPSVALSRLDRAAELILSEDQLSVRSEKGGYRMIRATHGFHHGLYYYECVMTHCDNISSHARVGWSTRFGELQAPIGFDMNSFGFCSGDGSRVHKRYRDQSYGEHSFVTGDIIGCYIRLDEVNPANNEMRFFKNGIDIGIAYAGAGEIPIGVYFPAISLFGKAEVTVNFGPSFILKHDIYGANGCSEAQPMNPDDRKEHELRIARLREQLGATKSGE